jgi:hypothetical protein
MSMFHFARRSGKQFYQAARLAAQRAIFAPTSDGITIHVAPYANVQPTEGGAFVDASIWVPDTALEPVRDESGRVVAPPQPVAPVRPAGPWDTNTAREDTHAKARHEHAR